MNNHKRFLTLRDRSNIFGTNPRKQECRAFSPTRYCNCVYRRMSPCSIRAHLRSKGFLFAAGSTHSFATHCHFSDRMYFYHTHSRAEFRKECIMSGMQKNPRPAGTKSNPHVHDRRHQTCRRHPPPIANTPFSPFPPQRATSFARHT